MGSFSSKKIYVNANLSDLPADPSLWIKINDYDPNIREQVRRAYLLKGSCQPQEHKFSMRPSREKLRRFNFVWVDENPTWLEYSIEKDAAYFLLCYHFKQHAKSNAHKDALGKCNDLLNQSQHIESIISRHLDEARIDCRTHLQASIDCSYFLLRQGLPFWRHDESEKLCNKGNFLELLHWLCIQNENVKVVTLKNTSENLKLTSPMIQKDIVSAIFHWNYKYNY